MIDQKPIKRSIRSTRTKALFNSTGSRVAVAEINSLSLYVWAADSGVLREILPHDGMEPTRLAHLDFVGDGTRIAASGTWMRYFRTPPIGKLSQGFVKKSGGYAGSLLRIWDIDSLGDELFRFASENWISGISSSIDGKTLTCFAGRERAFLLDLTKNRIVSVRPDSELDATDVLPGKPNDSTHNFQYAVSDDGMKAISDFIGSNGGEIKGLTLFDFGEKRCRFLPELELFQATRGKSSSDSKKVQSIISFALSADGKSLAVRWNVDQNRVDLIDLDSMKYKRSIEIAANRRIEKIVFGDKNRLAVVDSEHSISIFDTHGKLILSHESFEGQPIVGTVRFVNDSLMLLTGGVPPSDEHLINDELAIHRLYVRRIRLY